MNAAMDIIKKNLVSIICGVIALLAIGAVFWPISGMFEDLHTRAKKSESTYSALTGLLKKNRLLPQTDPKAIEPKPFDQVPTETAIAKGNAIKAQIEKEAKDLMATAVAINVGLTPQEKKELLEKDSLPALTPQAQTAGTKFREKYAPYVQKIPEKLMQAGMAPNQQDIDAKQKEVSDQIKTNDLAFNDRGQAVNQQQVDAKIAATKQLVPDQLRLETAQKIKVYIDPGTMDVMPKIGASTAAGRAPNPTDIWWAQLGIWIQEDICRSIADVNAPATNVMDAVVKRVMKIDPQENWPLSTGSTPQQNPNQDMGGGGGAAPVASNDPSAEIKKNPVLSPTGRSNNGLYDPVHFRLQLICDADHVPAVLQSLSKNKFITVFQMNIQTVDSGAEQSIGYIYGPRPVVMLDMEGEELFMRQWTVPLMPYRIKQSLGIQEQPATPQS
jgi:hypothetical protein